MNKKVLLLLMLITISIFSLSVQAKKETRGPAYSTTLNSGSGDVTIIYNYTQLLGLIDDENDLDICRYNLRNNKFHRWYGSLNAIENLLTVQVRNNKFPWIFVLCEVTDKCDDVDNDNNGLTDEGYCDCPTQASKFSFPPSTNLDELSTTELNAVDLTLAISTKGKIHWSNNVYSQCQDYDNYINIGEEFVSMDVDMLDKTHDTAASVELDGINCEDFTLYYNTGFFNNVEDLITDGSAIATEVSSQCDDGTSAGDVCDAVSCSNGVLTVSVKHFDSFGAESGEGGGEESPTIPEFNFIGVFLILLVSVIGLFFIKRKK